MIGSTDAPPALTADAMRAADEYTIEEYGIPSFTLMESAGRGAADRIQNAYGPLDGETVVILCGKGNNGGDGLVVARRLYAAGAHIHVCLTSNREDVRDDPARNLRLLEQLQTEDNTERLTIESLDTLSTLTDTVNRLSPHLYVDALLGTGLTSDLREPIRSLVDWVNDRPAPTVAIDIPTGLHSDTGAVLGTAVEAEHTITMAAPKVGLYVGEAPRLAGTVDVVDIGIPTFVLNRVVERPGCVRQTTDTTVRNWWPSRSPDAYKYSVGTAMVVGGSTRFTGAPRMASRAAVRSGAGYVTCACPASVQSTLAGTLTAVPTLPLSTTAEGLAPDAVRTVLDERADAILVGPGLGRGANTRQFVLRLVEESPDIPLVLDADGLNALADTETDWTKHANASWILTPHAGEFRRLAGTVDLTNRVRAVQEYAQRWGVTLLLKGNPSIVAAPNGTTFIGSTGTPALATAGTGDVLAGQCVGLLAQGLSPLPAAATALHLGGAAAQRYARTRDPRTLAAPDLIDELPRATHDRLGRKPE
ncbi:bifunctional ADP-dependent (S)-NAD(P)H-hydrate dehydratase/NAD(P)H-hydrate epimerase [Salinibacter sp. 10B]|uniref:NAD(P)H-hydrate dehydratase n=1 Tax=Salinibacter sp. 10B TaxID=1923971 RepID=UPI000D2DC95A|nr:NAD(P)H-hydrate dehydratase [Salinibacter sp. 10B]PQJ35573.1 bifunctional ADP-dependent (S)-NAD(P)H-hydrate dehydratase/NAD(P)H-hydrate epimerase [Salinibacter sp. 10B]